MSVNMREKADYCEQTFSMWQIVIHFIFLISWILSISHGTLMCMYTQWLAASIPAFLKPLKEQCWQNSYWESFAGMVLWAGHRLGLSCRGLGSGAGDISTGLHSDMEQSYFNERKEMHFFLGISGRTRCVSRQCSNVLIQQYVTGLLMSYIFTCVQLERAAHTQPQSAYIHMCADDCRAWFAVAFSEKTLLTQHCFCLFIFVCGAMHRVNMSFF